MAAEFAEPTDQEVQALFLRLENEAKQGGYFLNPDANFVKGLVRGLLVNEKRYGYRACPCRLAADDKSRDLDIICPCYYRDADVVESGACYCALYVSKAVLKGEQPLGSIPEEEAAYREATGKAASLRPKSGCREPEALRAGLEMSCLRLPLRKRRAA